MGESLDEQLVEYWVDEKDEKKVGWSVDCSAWKTVA
jgi:hypothetical protein